MKMNIATGRVSAVFIGVLLMSLGGIARATVVEGFESGAFSGSEATSGDVGIRGTYFTIAPTEGTKQTNVSISQLAKLAQDLRASVAGFKV
jgi:hypothetical protein